MDCYSKTVGHTVNWLQFGTHFGTISEHLGPIWGTSYTYMGCLWIFCVQGHKGEFGPQRPVSQQRLNHRAKLSKMTLVTHRWDKWWYMRYDGTCVYCLSPYGPRCLTTPWVFFKIHYIVRICLSSVCPMLIYSTFYSPRNMCSTRKLTFDYTRHNTIVTSL